MSIDRQCIFLFEYQPELSFGLKEIASYYPSIKTREDMDTADGSIKLHFLPDGEGANVSSALQDVTIRYRNKSDAFRSLGRILATAPETEDFLWNESLQFDTLGTMIDCSRGAVPTLEALMELVRYMALMGMNTLQLYMEDTYEIPQEEIFGLFRGAYTHDELRSIDNYAWAFGIEVWPCIQVMHFSI